MIIGPASLLEPGRPVVAALDPRVKLAWLLIQLFGFAVIRASLPLTLHLIAGLATALMGGIRLSTYRPLAKAAFFLGGQLVLLQGFLLAKGDVAGWVGPFALYWEGLRAGWQGVVILTGMALACHAFMACCHPLEIDLMLRWFGLPPALAQIGGLAARFLPLVRRDLVRIQEAQAVRGLRADGFFRRIAALGPVMVPLVLKTLQRADAVALTMERKGFGAGARPGHLMTLKMRSGDCIGLVAAVGYALLLLVAAFR